ncbi:hypothetical protein KA977_04425 [Candidatus Dependentiae bacterium]|nr:hypothetical protein [Candidatus Dependentiae bacterium]
MLFAEGNQRVYLYQKHRVLQFLNEINSKTKVLIAYHGAAAGEIAALGIIKFLQKKKNKNFTLFNFAELRIKEFEVLKSKIKTKKIDKLIILEGFGLPDCYAEFNDIAINIDSHFNDKEVITNFLNPIAAKFTPIPSVSLVVYDLLKEYIPQKYKWLIAVSSIIDYNSEAAQLIIQDEKDKVKKLPDIKYTFWACQYNETWGNKIIEKLIENPSVNILEKDEELLKRRKEFLKRIDEHIEIIKSKYKKGPVYYEVKSDTFRLTSPLASFLLDIYPDKLIFIVEKFENSDIVRISARYKNEEVNLGKICQKLAKNFKDTDAIGYKETVSFRTKTKMVKQIFEKLSQYC